MPKDAAKTATHLPVLWHLQVSCQSNLEVQIVRIGLASFLCFVLCFPRTALEALTELSEVLPSTTEKEILQPLHIFSNGDFKWGSLVSLLSRNGEVLLVTRGHPRPSWNCWRMKLLRRDAPFASRASLSGNEGWKLPRTRIFWAFGSGNGEHFRGRRCEPICFVIRALAGALRKTDQFFAFFDCQSVVNAGSSACGTSSCEATSRSWFYIVISDPCVWANT